MKTKLAPASAARLVHQTQALQLRVHGHTLRQIAKALECSLTQAHRLVTAAMAAERASISETKADYVELELSRLDKYLAVLAKKIEGGDVKAVDTALRVADRRAKLLGLDAPTKVAPTDAAGNDLPMAPQQVSLAELPIDLVRALRDHVRGALGG